MSKANDFDAIVVGTGISGGWAAKELCERGLRTLVLERGRDVEHVRDYPTAGKAPWELPYGDALTQADKQHMPVQSRCEWAVLQSTKHWFVDDTEHPYVEEKPFDWIRGYHVGGRSLTWARQCYRLADLDFEANARDGHGVDWPIRYRDIAPWYDHVEAFIGISGQAEGLAHWPDGNFLPPMQMNCLEASLKERWRARYPDRVLTIGRVANLTQPHNGRGQCQNRDLCMRGCPYGAYFSSNSSTLPAAARTGKMTLRPDSIVGSLIWDEPSGRVTGVRVIDAHTSETREYFARVIFLNASTLATTSILLNSTSRRFPSGLGNDSGELGHNLMDHHSGGAFGLSEEFGDRYHRGRRPNGICIPRFRNVSEQRDDYVRGFYYAGAARRSGFWGPVHDVPSMGAGLKASLEKPGPWYIDLWAMAEVLPYHDNRVALHPERRDRWGLPLLSIRCEYRENEAKMRDDIKATAAEMLEAGGLKYVTPFGDGSTPGSIIHEMGTARMGRDPKTSVLNAHNQVHAAPNVFVSDGSCMTSSGCQNPSFTYMALTARAAAHAVDELKRGNL